MAKFNGHKNWNHWNVSLWLNNDERLYRRARWLCAEFGTDRAARYLLQWLSCMDEAKTPDGAPYSVTTIKTAMRGMEA